MRKILVTSAAVIALGAVAFAQSVGWPPPGGMLAALGVYNSSPPTLTNGQVSPVQLSSAGRLLVDAAVVGGGDATAANQTAVQAPVAPATATATKSELIGCQATSAAITPTTGQQAAVDCDLNNNLLVSSGGAPNLTIAQVSIATSDTLAIAARALRRSVTIQQITGTQNVFCNQTTATAANGVVLPAVVGASFTFNTTSAIRCIAITGAQTVAVAETF